MILLDMNFTKDAISGQEGFDALSQILEIGGNDHRNLLTDDDKNSCFRESFV